MHKDQIENPNTIINDNIDWDSWLSEYERNLKDHGYIKFNQKHKNEDFCYWKTFKDGETKIYQIGVLFYDFRPYAYRDPMANRIGTMYQCMILCDARIDMDVSAEIDLAEFERMAKTFYESMSKYIQYFVRQPK